MANQLLEILGGLHNQRIAVVGDLILDRYLWGNVDRISPEAPVPIVEQVRREDRLGGAANVLHNLSGLGLSVDVYGVCGSDQAGVSLTRMLASLGCDKSMVVVDEQRPTTIKTRIISGNQQMLRLDLEDRKTLDSECTEELLSAFSKRYDTYSAVVVSDYGKGVITSTLLDGVHSYLSSDQPVIIDPHPSNFTRYKGGFLLKPNRKEAETAAGRVITDIPSAFEVAKILLQRWQASNVLITMGPLGMVLMSEGDDTGVHFCARTQRVFDVSGAGDCVTAIVAACLGKGINWNQTCELANIAAGVVIAEVGTVAIDMKKLIDGISQTE